MTLLCFEIEIVVIKNCTPKWFHTSYCQVSPPKHKQHVLAGAPLNRAYVCPNKHNYQHWKLARTHCSLTSGIPELHSCRSCVVSITGFPEETFCHLRSIITTKDQPMIKTKEEQFCHIWSIIATKDQAIIKTIGEHFSTCDQWSNPKVQLCRIAEQLIIVIFAIVQWSEPKSGNLGYVGNDKADTNLYWFSRLTSSVPASMIKSEDEIRSLSWKGTKRESYLLPKREMRYHAMYILHILQNDQNKWVVILEPMGNDKNGNFLLVSPIIHFHVRQWSKARVE